MVRFGLILLFAALLLGGCGDIYTHVYDREAASKKIGCLKIEGSVSECQALRHHPFIQKLQTSPCSYRLVASGNTVTSCSSYMGKAIGADFDGYIRLDLYRDQKLIWRIQRDFKGELNDRIVDSLVKKMQSDLLFAP